MTFRTRLLVTFLLTVLLPIIALALFIRVEMTNRLTAQYERRVDALVNVLEEDLDAESAAIAKSLVASVGFAILLSFTPVRLTIHSSEVSTIFSKSFISLIY